MEIDTLFILFLFTLLIFVVAWAVALATPYGTRIFEISMAVLEGSVIFLLGMGATVMCSSEGGLWGGICLLYVAVTFRLPSNWRLLRRMFRRQRPLDPPQRN